MKAEQRVSERRHGQLLVLTACRAGGMQFVVAQPAQRDDPCLKRTRNPGNVGSTVMPENTARRPPHLTRFSHSLGHEDQFRPPTLNGGYRLGEATFAGTRGNGRRAPFRGAHPARSSRRRASPLGRRGTATEGSVLKITSPRRTSR